jgi:branched-chain amino acid aminotransferase
MIFWLNGEFKKDATAISIADRGFLLGDGLFETLLLVDGVPAFLSEHLARMTVGAKALKIAVAYGERDIGDAIAALAKRNGAGAGHASARVSLTRGAGSRGISIASGDFSGTLLITVSAIETSNEPKLTNLIISKHRRNEKSVTARCKTLNYLDNILARNEAMEAGADDALMLNTQGDIACASAANFFAIRSGIVATPPIEGGALPGVVRAALINVVKNEGIQVAEAPIDPTQLSGSTMFITNSLIGLRRCEMPEVESGSSADQAVFERLKSCYAKILSSDAGRRRASA